MENRPEKKDAAYYSTQRTKSEKYIKGNEFHTILEGLDTVNTRTICLLTIDMMSCKFIGVSRETREEAIKSLNIGPKVLARRSNTMWEILLANKQEANQLAGSILMSKVVWLQTESMGTGRTKITIQVYLWISPKIFLNTVTLRTLVL